MSGRRLLPGLVAAAVLLYGAGAGAAVWKVGPEEALTLPSQAARMAGDGDTVEIAAGEYFDCAVWPQRDLTITGSSDRLAPTVLTDAACQGKALFVVMGRGVTIRHLTFTRVRVPDGNGAGIRAEGPDLTVAHSRFINNQSGIVAADAPDGTLAILDSVFERNGAARDERCVATVQAGRLRVLRVERSRFGFARACDMVRGAARRTEVVDSRFEDGPAGAAQAMLALAGGDVLVRGSSFAKGTKAAPPDVAILVRDLWGGGGVVEVRDSVLANDSGRRVALVHNLSAGRAVLAGNRVGPGDVELDESGFWVARTRSMARDAVDTARGVAGKVTRGVRGLLPF